MMRPILWSKVFVRASLLYRLDQIREKERALNELVSIITEPARPAASSTGSWCSLAFQAVYKQNSFLLKASCSFPRRPSICSIKLIHIILHNPFYSYFLNLTLHLLRAFMATSLVVFDQGSGHSSLAMFMQDINHWTN